MSRYDDEYFFVGKASDDRLPSLIPDAKTEDQYCNRESPSNRGRRALPPDHSSMIYLRSYDAYKETLEYDVDAGASRLVSREEVERAGVQRTFGMFTRVGDRFFGVYATPEGPVFFGDDIRILGRVGVTRGHVELNKATRIHRFALFDDSRLVLSTHYPEREGLGTNPYDTKPEDVDMFAAIAKGILVEYFPDSRAFRRAVSLDGGGVGQGLRLCC